MNELDAVLDPIGEVVAWLACNDATKLDPDILASIMARPGFMRTWQGDDGMASILMSELPLYRKAAKLAGLKLTVHLDKRQFLGRTTLNGVELHKVWTLPITLEEDR